MFPDFRKGIRSGMAECQLFDVFAYTADCISPGCQDAQDPFNATYAATLIGCNPAQGSERYRVTVKNP